MDKYKTSTLGKALKQVFKGEISVNDSVLLAKKEISDVFNRPSQSVETDTDTGFYGDKVGVKIAVENMRVVHNSYPTHRYCQDPDELCEVADALGASVCWDFGHANLGGLCQSEALRYLGNRVKVLHVNDNTRADDDHLPPFIGNIDWKDAMKGLSEIGFTGLFNYEIETKRIPKELRDPFADYLVEAAREIISYRER
jgi:sugar phosphate isomerase/epimerase